MNRIVYLVGQLRAGGLERQLVCLLSALDRERYTPAVVVWSFHEDDIHLKRVHALGVPVHPIDPRLPAMVKLARFRALVARLQPEVIHSYSFYTNVAVTLACAGSRTVAIGAVQASLAHSFSEVGWPISLLSAALPRHQIYNNAAAAREASRSQSPFVPARVTVVRNGMDVAAWPTTTPPAGRPLILGIGSLFPVKRWDRLLRAAADLKGRGLDFGVQIAGEGPLRADLEASRRALGLEDRVQLPGTCDDIPSLLTRASILAHTSSTEGCPNVVMEAMAAARAVVATNVGDVPELVLEGKSGFVVPEDDPRPFHDRLAELVADAPRCRAMGLCGRAHAERHFGQDRLVAETLAAYRAAGWQDAERRQG